MHSIPLLLAWRYLKSSRLNTAIATMSIICCAAIAIGTASLSLVIAIMQGFEQATYAKLKGVHADIMIQIPSQKSAEKLLHVLKHNPAILSLSASSSQNGLVQTSGAHHAVFIKGINAQEESATRTLASLLKHSTPGITLQSALEHNRVIIGHELAQLLQVNIGDTLTLLFPSEYQTQRTKILLDKEQVTIGGIIKTGVEEYDSMMILCDLSLFFDLFPESAIDTISVTLHKDVDAVVAIKILRTMLPSYTMYTWQDLYPAIVSALKLEKYVMILVVSLISLVASATIMAVLFMLIIFKQRDIALLLTLGLSVRTLHLIFIFIACLLSLIGSLIGLSISWLLGTILNTYKLIHLPDAYYIDYLPILVSHKVYGGVFIVTMAISCFIAILTVRKISKGQTLSILRSGV